MNVQISAVGAYLREWRHRRRLSQLDFALQAEISQRHLSFMESGRATPSREMLLKLAEHLDVPLQLRTDHGLLSFFSTTTVFGTAVDITLLELTLESFFPANAETAEALRTAQWPSRLRPT